MIEQIYKKCLKKKPNKKDNVWLILEYDSKKDLYKPKIILEDGKTKIDGKKEYIGNWQKKGQPGGGGDFWLSEGVGKLGLDEDFYDTTKLDTELERVIRDFCTKNKTNKVKDDYVNNPKKTMIKMIEIPKQLQKQGFNFCLVNKWDAKNKDGDDIGKAPLEKGWPKKIHRMDDPILLKHIKNGGNYGVQSNNSDVIIDGISRFLVIVDFDEKEFMDKVIDKFPETFTTTSGSDKKCYHIWLASDDNKSFKIKDINKETLADFLGAGNQVIAPGSKHTSGSSYSIVKDIPIVFVPYSEIEALLKPYDKTPKKVKKPIKQYIPKGVGNDFSQKIMDSISMEDILSKLGVDTSKNPTNCPLHSSNGGKCLSWTDEVVHCFNCDGNWNKFSFVREVKNLTDKDTFDWLAGEAGMIDELEQNRKEYNESKKKEKKESKGINLDIFGRWGQAEAFYKQNPFFYDEKKIFWIWDKEDFYYKEIDEVGILNEIKKEMSVGIIESRSRNEIINVLKQVGREKIPKEIKKSWVQFKNKIYDIETEESFDATSEYFITNPILWGVGNSEDTPIIDKLFISWVGEEHKKELYELIAFCCVPSYFIHRIFFFFGSGSNGKSTFDNLLEKFLGSHNITTSSLERIEINSRFETAKFFKKLVVLMSETSEDMKKIEVIKRASGEEKIPAEMKNKNPFDFLNYAKMIIPTNEIPKASDVSDGFYRRIKIIDFPNQFLKEADVISIISKEEYENLVCKCLRIMKELWKNRIFSNDGDFSERRKRYQDRAKSIVLKFIDIKCETEDICIYSF